MDRARTVLDALLRAGRADPAAFAPSFLKEISAARVDAILTQVTAALGSFDRIDGTHGTYLAHYPRGTDLITVTMDERDRITGLIFAPPVIAGRPGAALSPGSRSSSIRASVAGGFFACAASVSMQTHHSR